MEPSAIGDEVEAQQMDVDNTAVESTALAVENIASSSDTNRARSNSVIDSYCRKNAVEFRQRVRNRTRSLCLSTTDYYKSTELYQKTDYLCIAGTSQTDEMKKSDTTDDEANNISLNKTSTQQSQDTSNLFQFNEMKKLDVESLKSETDAKANNILLNQISDSCAFNEPVAFASVARDADCYNMNHKNRGKCIIFNHEKFDLGNYKRVGSSLDAIRLKKSFGNLGFDVEVHNDFTHKEIVDKIDIVRQLDHTNNDCLCVITLTHGEHNDLLCAKDVIYKSDMLWKPFTADKCITLAGKPKLFFIQACRGDEADSGITLTSRSLKNNSETDSRTSYNIPTYADFLIAHSSIQGFFTWRNPEEGTWYIQCLCDVLDEYGTTMELMNILTLTSRKVATEYSSINTINLTLHNKKQVPSVTTMLIRNVYFPPKSKNE